MATVASAPPAKPSSNSPQPNTSLLDTFQAHIEDMRNLVQCKICIKPLYEPYTLNCGHTYCYSCLTSWFSSTVSRRKRKNCPDCRAHVTVQPSPNYLLRELVHMFISRAELLPEDETTAEHIEAKSAEESQIENDRKNEEEGLFKGAFRHTHSGRHLLHHLAGPIHDTDDNVERCPQCAWELEDGMCQHCGYNEDDEASYFSDDDVSLQSIVSISSELDGELVAEDGAEDYDDEDHYLDDDHHHHHHHLRLFGYELGPGHRHTHPRRDHHTHRGIDDDGGPNPDVAVQESNQPFIHPTRRHLHHQSGGTPNNNSLAETAPLNENRPRAEQSNRFRVFNNPYDTESSEADGSAVLDSDEDDDEDMDSFIDDGVEGGYRRDHQHTPSDGPPSSPLGDSEVLGEEQTALLTFYGIGRSAEFSDEDDGGTMRGSPSVHTSDEDTETPRGPGRQSTATNRLPRRPAARIIDESDDDDDEDTATTGESEVSSDDTETTQDNEDSDDDSEDSDDSDDEEEEEPPLQTRRSLPPPAPPQPTADRVARRNAQRVRRATVGRSRGAARGRGRL